MSSRTLELSSDIARVAAWLESTLDGLEFGEVSVVIKRHAGRSDLIERHLMTRDRAGDTAQHTGSAGAHHDRRDR